MPAAATKISFERERSVSTESAMLRRLKLALTGFVFSEPEGVFIFITVCGNEASVHFRYKEIGFVLHN